MKSWYKTATKKRREYQFDNSDNVYYKILEKQEPFEEDDTIRVYHAFRDMNDALITAQHGLSGQSRAARVYSYESNNNPKGLFITTNLDTAKKFTIYGAIMEFTCKYSELEIPVWPGGGYTVQGQMSQYWDYDRIEEQRQEAILKQREEAKKSKYEAIANSSRPELAEMLTSPSEYQALFTGHLNPTRIEGFWVQERTGSQPLLTDPWNELSREEFIESVEYQMSVGFDKQPRIADQHMEIQSKVFLPEDPFDPTTFVQKLAENTRNTPQELIEIIKGWSADDAMNYLSRYVWPNQTTGLQQWINNLFGN